jgi:hypothetical protein
MDANAIALRLDQKTLAGERYGVSPYAGPYPAATGGVFAWFVLEHDAKVFARSLDAYVWDLVEGELIPMEQS